MAKGRKGTRSQPVRKFTPYRWISFKFGRKPRGRAFKEHEQDSVLELSSKISGERLQLASRLASLYDARFGVIRYEPIDPIELPFQTQSWRHAEGSGEQSRTQEVKEEIRPQILPDGGVPPENVADTCSLTSAAQNTTVSAISPDRPELLPSANSPVIASSETPLHAALEQPERKSPSPSQEIVTATRAGQEPYAHVSEFEPKKESRSSDDGQSKDSGRNDGERLVSQFEPRVNEGEAETTTRTSPNRGVPSRKSKDSHSQSTVNASSLDESGSTSRRSSPSPHQNLKGRRQSSSSSSCSSRYVLGSPESRAPEELSQISDGCSPPKSMKSTTLVSDSRVSNIPESQSSDSLLNSSRDNVAVDNMRSFVEAPPRNVVVQRRKRNSSQRFSSPSTPVSDSTASPETPDPGPLGLGTSVARLPNDRSLERFSKNSNELARSIEEESPSNDKSQSEFPDQKDGSTPDAPSVLRKFESVEVLQRDVVLEQAEGDSPPDSPRRLPSTPASDSDIFSEALPPGSPELQTCLPGQAGAESSELSLQLPIEIVTSPSKSFHNTTLKQLDQNSQSLSPEIVTAMRVAHFKVSDAHGITGSTPEARSELRKSESSEKNSPDDSFCNTTSKQLEQNSTSLSPEIVTARRVGRTQGSVAHGICKSTLDASSGLQKSDSSESDYDSVEGSCSAEKGALLIGTESIPSDKSQSEVFDQKQGSTPDGSSGLRRSNSPESDRDSVKGSCSSEEIALPMEAESSSTGKSKSKIFEQKRGSMPNASSGLRRPNSPDSERDLVEDSCSSEEVALPMEAESSSTDKSQSEVSEQKQGSTPHASSGLRKPNSPDSERDSVKSSCSSEEIALPMEAESSSTDKSQSEVFEQKQGSTPDASSRLRRPNSPGSERDSFEGSYSSEEVALPMEAEYSSTDKGQSEVFEQKQGSTPGASSGLRRPNSPESERDSFEGSCSSEEVALPMEAESPPTDKSQSEVFEQKRGSTPDAFSGLRRPDSSESERDSVEGSYSSEELVLLMEAVSPSTDKSQSEVSKQKHGSMPDAFSGLREPNSPESERDSVEDSCSSEEVALPMEAESSYTDKSQPEAFEQKRGSTPDASSGLRRPNSPDSERDSVEGSYSSEELVLLMEAESPSTDKSQSEVSDPTKVLSRSQTPDSNGTPPEDDPQLHHERPARFYPSSAESVGSTSRENSPEAAASFLKMALDRQDEETKSPSGRNRRIFESSSSSPDSTQEKTALETLVTDAENSNSDDLSSFWFDSARKETVESSDDS